MWKQVWNTIQCFFKGHSFKHTGNAWFKCRRCGKEEGLL